MFFSLYLTGSLAILANMQFRMFTPRVCVKIVLGAANVWNVISKTLIRLIWRMAHSNLLLDNKIFWHTGLVLSSEKYSCIICHVSFFLKVFITPAFRLLGPSLAKIVIQEEGYLNLPVLSFNQTNASRVSFMFYVVWGYSKWLNVIYRHVTYRHEKKINIVSI